MVHSPLTIVTAFRTNFMVRKITVFVSVNNTSGVQQNHPPPNPVLLLGKAASNWLKLQGLFVQPGCDADESSSDSSDFVAPLRDELAIHEMSYEQVISLIHQFDGCASE